jgi:glycosyltransferase involved in cell wall biosynthesis
MWVTGTLAHGGAERHSITLMNRFADRGHQCHAVYIKDTPLQNQLDRINLRDGMSVRCMAAQRFFDPQAITRFATHLTEIRPSVIVAANGYALMYATLAVIRSGLRIPIVATCHTTQLIGLKDQLKMLIDRLFYWRASCTVFVCEMQRKYWWRRGVASRRNTVIYNGVDTAHFVDTSTPEARQALRNSLGFSAADYVVGISAVLRPEKNHVQLLDAVAVLRRQGIPARLLMIGDGPMREVIEARGRELGIEGAIRITGFQQDVRQSIALCDVMVLCSLSETFSLAALESMAMGKPVIHSDVGGAKEMIAAGFNGELFALGDTQALVDCLENLAKSGVAKAMGVNARAVVEARFSEKAMVDRYENLLLDLCSRSSGSGAAVCGLNAMEHQ